MQVIPTLALGWRTPARLLFHPGNLCLPHGLLNKGHSMRHVVCGRTPLGDLHGPVLRSSLADLAMAFRASASLSTGGPVTPLSLLSRILSRLSKR